MAAFTAEQMQDFSISKWYELSGRTAIVTGGATGLTPPAVMLSVLLGGSAFGWVGMLLAIPFVCVARCVWRIVLAERCIPQP